MPWDLRPPRLRGKSWRLVGSDDEPFAEAIVAASRMAALPIRCR
jgi:hypothetical protein